MIREMKLAVFTFDEKLEEIVRWQYPPEVN
jgi:hypothetical protein